MNYQILNDDIRTKSVTQFAKLSEYKLDNLFKGLKKVLLKLGNTFLNTQNM